MSENEKLLTLTEAARRFGCSTATLRRAIGLGQLQAEKYGSFWLVEAAAMEAWVAQHYKPEMARRYPARRKGASPG